MLCGQVSQLVVRLIVDYFTYAARPGASARPRLAVDYFAYVARPDASARRRLLRLHHTI
jgi:hypothetical protein